MSRLSHPKSGRRFTLGATTLVGRSSSCTLTVDDPRASSRHATIIYVDGGWIVRDLGSRNGTWVDGKRLESGGRAPIAAGGTVRFADAAWRLLEADPPVAAAEDAQGRRRLAPHGLLALPDDDDPEVTIYAAVGGRWIAEQDGEPRKVRDGQTLTVGGVEWTLELPPAVPGGGTQATAGAEDGAMSIETLTRLRLAVSRDEETVEVSLAFFGAPMTLPPRSFGYLLVVLARARAADAGEPSAEQGWMYAEDVCREVGIDPERLNVEIYRCRKLLARLGVQSAAGLFERRPHTRQLRLGVTCAEIVPL